MQNVKLFPGILSVEEIKKNRVKKVSSFFMYLNL